MGWGSRRSPVRADRRSGGSTRRRPSSISSSVSSRTRRAADEARRSRIAWPMKTSSCRQSPASSSHFSRMAARAGIVSRPLVLGKELPQSASRRSRGGSRRPACDRLPISRGVAVGEQNQPLQAEEPAVRPRLRTRARAGVRDGGQAPAVNARGDSVRSPTRPRARHGAPSARRASARLLEAEEAGCRSLGRAAHVPSSSSRSVPRRSSRAGRRRARHVAPRRPRSDFETRITSANSTCSTRKIGDGPLVFGRRLAAVVLQAPRRRSVSRRGSGRHRRR